MATSASSRVSRRRHRARPAARVSSFNFGLRALSAGIASALADGGKGRIREAVEAVRDDLIGDGALHVAAAHGRTRVCAYLVEELHMDVNAAAVSGAACGST